MGVKHTALKNTKHLAVFMVIIYIVIHTVSILVLQSLVQWLMTGLCNIKLAQKGASH
jgi:hypothetical protein